MAKVDMLHIFLENFSIDKDTVESKINKWGFFKTPMTKTRLEDLGISLVEKIEDI